jgi:cyclohexa-1,5-dienecarbonyl-CoA hydratase
MTEGPTSTAPPVRLDVEGCVARIVIDRPSLNVLDVPTNRALAAAVRSVRERRGVKVLILAGAGARAFSAGVEVADHAPERVREMLEAFHSVFRELRQALPVTVAAVHGMALGGGLELATFCDVVVAEENSLLGFPEIKLGCFPPVALVCLPQLIGPQRAAEMILGGETIDAREAERIGLVTRVVAPGSLPREIANYIERFTDKSGAALALTTQALRRRRCMDFEDALREVERLYLDRLMQTADAREGIAAFLEKRAPRWRDA